MAKQMDRSWVYGKPFTLAYVKGVEEFMKHVSDRFPEDTEIRCPCRDCLNQRMLPQFEVENHIHVYGMSVTYTRWIHHGEPGDINVVEEQIMTLGYMWMWEMMSMMMIMECQR